MSPSPTLLWFVVAPVLFGLAWTTDILICRYYWRKHGARIGFAQFCRGLAGTWHLRLDADLRKAVGLRPSISEDEVIAIEQQVRRPEFADVGFWRLMAAWCWVVMLALVFITLLAPPT